MFSHMKNIGDNKFKTTSLVLMLLFTVVMIVQFAPPAKALFGTRFDKYEGNPLSTIPSYGASGVVHPDVLYFAEGMDGYKYWMVYTPYPPQSKENPSIVRSNDGITWTDSGIANPVIPAGAPGAWNDLENPDPDFIYVPDYGKWFMVWDGGDVATNSRKIALAYSSDGKSWIQYNGALVNGNPNPIILSGDDFWGQAWERLGAISKVSCPTLLYENGIFYLYYVEEASGNNRGQAGYATFTWNDVTRSVENLVRYNNNPTIDLPEDGVFLSGCGHIDLSKWGNVYYMYVVREISDGSSALALLTSTDKISWANQGKVLEGGDWDLNIYRSSATVDQTGQIALFDGKMKLYYSAFGNPQIGLATSGGAPAWYDSSWTRRKLITIENTNPNSLSGYQVEINVDYDSDMKPDFSDLRFTDSDGVTLIPYWIESYVASASAVVWVRVPSIPGSSAKTIYMYYGNTGATSVSNGPDTFEFFDDFETGEAPPPPGTPPWTEKQQMPSPRSDLTCAVYNGKLYAFGGYRSGGVWSKETYEYNPSTNAWTRKADMPTARWGPVAVEYNGKIHVFSGTYQQMNEVYDPVANSWETLPDMPPGFDQGLMGVKYGDRIHLLYRTKHYAYDPRTGTYEAKAPMLTSVSWATCAVVDNKIYIIGGYPTTNVNQVYNPSTNSWSYRAPMPVSKYGATRENPVINGKIYVTHGLDGGFHTDNYVYDPISNTWEQKSSALHPRDGMGCGVINNKLYVVGGRDLYANPVGLVYNEEYDPLRETGGGTPSTWTEKQQMPSPPKSDGTAAVYNGKLYVFGGYNNGASDPRSETYEYDPSTNTWTTKANMPTARWGPIAVEYNGKIYVFSGTAPRVNQVYDPVTNSWQTKRAMPSGCNQGLMGVRYGDRIHLFYQTLHYEYNPTTDTYVTKAPMPTSRTWSTCAVVGDKIYVIGGWPTTDVNEVYDPATDTWTTKEPMPVSKYGATRENPVINGKIYVTHGLDGGFHTDNYVYDPSTDSWQQKSSATYPRDGVQCGVINNKLYVVGGRDLYANPVGLVYNEEYDPSADTGIQWSISDPDKVKRDTTAKYEGNYGLMIYDDTTNTEYAEHTHSLSTLAMDVYWELTNALGEVNLQPTGRILLHNQATYGSLSYYRHTDGVPEFEWYNGALNYLQEGSYNTWYRITIIWNGASSKVIINGVEHGVSATSAASDRIRLESSSVEQSKMFFDLVRVRKYSSPEPTISIGPEEVVFSPPVANFAWSPAIPKAEKTVTFDGSSSTSSGGTIVKYEWNFGDGGTASGQIVAHTYTGQGTYSVTLNVTDSQGLWDTEQKQIQVDPASQLTLTSDGFESGAITEADGGVWTNTVTSSGEAATVVTTDPHHGTKHADFECGGSSIGEMASAYKDFVSSYTEVYARMYVKFKTALPANNKFYYVMTFENQAVDSWIFEVTVINDAGTIKWQLCVLESWTRVSYNYASGPSLNVYYCVELYGRVHATEGYGALYINGVKILQSNNADTDNRGNIDRLYIGERWSSGQTAHGIYIDCVVAADTYIGPEV